MSRRASVAAGLALLIATSLTPAGATVLCVASNGSVAVEPAVGAARHCPDADADSSRRAGIGSRQHSCRDLLVPQGALPSHGAPLVAAAAQGMTVDRPAAPAAGMAGRRPRRTAATPHALRRSVVLLL